MLLLAILGAMWHPQMDPKKWSGFMPQCLKLENNPLIKSLGQFFQEKWSKTTRKQIFMLFLAILGLFGHPQMDSKRYTKAGKWTGCTTQ
jgi:hypothetical protein